MNEKLRHEFKKSPYPLLDSQMLATTLGTPAMPSWIPVSERHPSASDLDANGEVLVRDTDGCHHTCEPGCAIERNGSTYWFNGDVYVEPLCWMKIPT